MTCEDENRRIECRVPAEIAAGAAVELFLVVVAIGLFFAFGDGFSQSLKDELCCRSNEVLCFKAAN